jgi:hypothetical protein
MVLLSSNRAPVYPSCAARSELNVSPNCVKGHHSFLTRLTFASADSERLMVLLASNRAPVSPSCAARSELNVFPNCVKGHHSFLTRLTFASADSERLMVLLSSNRAPVYPSCAAHSGLNVFPNCVKGHHSFLTRLTFAVLTVRGKWFCFPLTVRPSLPAEPHALSRSGVIPHLCQRLYSMFK